MTWMTTREASEHLRVSPRTLSRYVRAGLITQYRVKGRAAYWRPDLDNAMTRKDTSHAA